MNLTQAARVLNINPRTLHLAVERGQIEARHSLPDGPWVINRRALQTSAAADLVQRGKQSALFRAVTTCGVRLQGPQIGVWSLDKKLLTRSSSYKPFWISDRDSVWHCNR